MREYTLDVFREKPLSQDFLNAVDKDLASVREAGLKDCWENNTSFNKLNYTLTLTPSHVPGKVTLSHVPGKVTPSHVP